MVREQASTMQDRQPPFAMCVTQSLTTPSTLEDLTGLTQLHADSEAVLALQACDSEDEGMARTEDEDDWHEI